MASHVACFSVISVWVARLIQVSILLGIGAVDLYLVSTGAVKSSLVVVQIMMILTVMILSRARRRRT
ncbi:MAG: hypothetical protein FJW36_10320 [Acidobacteria bacterium]|nr:hypothetical protein [Acidobacteriota bacterium]